MVPNTSTDITAKRFLAAFSIGGVVRMSVSSPAKITPFVHCPAHLLDNISGTQTSSDMILDSYESPARGLSYAVPFVSIFQVFYEKYGELLNPKFRSEWHDHPFCERVLFIERYRRAPTIPSTRKPLGSTILLHTYTHTYTPTEL